jgi:hypothetical protein
MSNMVLYPKAQFILYFAHFVSVISLIGQLA